MSASAMMNASRRKYKIVLLGDSGVGKSSLAHRLVKDEFSSDLNSTVGASFFRYCCPVEGHEPVYFDIWDTAGQERYKSLASMYYRGAAAALVVYEINSHDTFERAKYWVQELGANSPDTMIQLVGNKRDLAISREVSEEECYQYASTQQDMMCTEASAKTGEGVQEAFLNIAKRLIEKNSEMHVRPSGVIGSGQHGTSSSLGEGQGSSRFGLGSIDTSRASSTCC